MIIESWLARIGIVVVLVVLAFGAGWLRGHNRGWDGAQARDAKVVAALMAAKASDEATIAELKQANAAFASAAAAQQARAQDAVKALQAQREQSQRALTEAGRKLDEAIHADQDAAHIGAEHIPAGVVRVLK